MYCNFYSTNAIAVLIHEEYMRSELHFSLYYLTEQGNRERRVNMPHKIDVSFRWRQYIVGYGARKLVVITEERSLIGKKSIC